MPAEKRQRVITDPEDDPSQAHRLPPGVRMGGEQGYKRGSIKRITMTNFMSYNYASFCPGPRLNLILAPNGCGKSSIVAAICLGLSGQAKLLGKSNHLKDFVQRGKDTATLEIELFISKERTTTIRREIHLNSSRWFIDGKEKREGDVQTLVDSLNIRLDNLTSFLPQEKVANFSQLSPVELLDQTEQAVLPQVVVQLHADLILLSKDLGQKERVLEQFEKKAQVLRNLNDMDERDVVKFEKRNELLQKAGIYCLKILREVFYHQKEEGMRLREEKQKLENEKDTFKREKYEPSEAKRSELQKAQKDADLKHERFEGAKKKADEDHTRYKKEYSKVTGEIQSLIEEEKQLQDREQGRIKELERHQRQKASLEAELEGLTTSDQLRADMETATANAKALGNESSDRWKQIADLQECMEQSRADLDEVSSRLRSLRDVKKVRLQRVAQRDSQVAYVWRWIEENIGQMEKNVYLPALEINLTLGDDNHAKYIEQAVPWSFLYGIMCESPRDRELISAECRDRQRKSFSIFVRAASVADNQEPTRLCNIGDLHQVGITHWLDQTFTAPTAVMAALRDQFHVNWMAVARADVNPDAALAVCNDLRTIFTPRDRYQMLKSRYGNRERSTKVTRLPNEGSGIFKDNTAPDTAQKVRKEEELKQKIVELNQQLVTEKNKEAPLRTKREEWNQKKRELQDQMKKWESVKRQIAQKVKDIQRLEQEDTERDKKRICARVRVQNAKRVNILENIQSCMERLVDTTLQQGLTHCNKLELQQKWQLFEDASKEVKSQMGLKEQKFVEADTAYRRVIKDHQEKKKEYEQRKRDYVSEWFKDLPPGEGSQKLTAALQEIMVSDLTALRDEESRFREEADQIVANPQKVAEWKQRKKEIDELDAKLVSQRQVVSDVKVQMDKKRDLWLPQLHNALDGLNKTFTEFCEYAGIGGELELKPKVDTNGKELPDEYGDYHINLKCRFRTGETMQRLSGQHQSGGERAVVTILYLLALQSCTSCPFRVVDEIDQGMDESNQQKMFLKMLESSASDQAPQSFLITPKFMPNTIPENASNVDIFFVMNSPHGLLQDTWDTASQCNRV
mmetsp:Transcript_133196/g.230978  ORF Transcript_133196/g.230978 Transcript_133196/m.230978 type:complete len:1084 (-) Transcript_133196:407-3658(-)